MKKVLLLLVMGAMVAMSCNDDDPQVDREAQREIDDELIREYIGQNMLDAQSTSSGLYYIIEEPGGDEKPTLQNEIAIIYTGRLLNGSEFDSSNGQVVQFPLANLIEGWQEGIPLFGKGGRGVLIVPSHLGYGSRPVGPIPANSVLEFDIQLVDFN